MRRRDAVDSLFGGDRVGKRVQRVYTPPIVCSVIDRVWPEGLVCDPCSGPDSIVPALLRIMPPANGCKYILEVPGETGAACDPDKDLRSSCAWPFVPGIERWPERTYINPEFGDLQEWIRQFVESWEVIMLSPVRTHRRWYRASMRKPAVVAYLDPLAFIGHEQKFPAPLALTYRGSRRFAFERAIEETKIGEVV